MGRSAKAAGGAVDRREEHYLRRMRQHSERYEDFHWQSVEMLVNLIYTCDVIQSHMARCIDAHGLTLGSFNALMILSRFEEEGCPMHELGELLLVSRANTTGLVDLLERKGLVERFASQADRRVRLVRLTRAGRALLESVLPGHYQRVREMLRGVSNKDKAALSDLLTKLRHNVLRTLRACAASGARARATKTSKGS